MHKMFDVLLQKVTRHRASTSMYSLTFCVETDRNSFSFSFSAPKMTIFDGFGHFRFRPKMYFHFRLFFVFGQKRSNFRP